MKLPCPKCKKDVEIELSESGPHVKASCLECGAYIKFMSQTELEGKPMSEFEQTFKIESSKYGELITLQKRGDDYSVVSMQASKDGGTNYLRWVFPQRRVDNKNVPAEKAIPLGLKLGSRTEAIAFFKWGLAALSPPAAQKNDGEDIPF
jgi:hypothetical protein